MIDESAEKLRKLVASLDEPIAANKKIIRNLKKMTSTAFQLKDKKIHNALGMGYLYDERMRAGSIEKFNEMLGKEISNYLPLRWV
jgi:hypothetical protein